jgi:hypothetical protein
VELEVDDDRLILTALAADDALAECWGAMEKAHLLERTFGRRVEVHVRQVSG